MKKSGNIILVFGLGIVLPFVIVRLSLEYAFLTALASIMYYYAVYLPFLCGWLGIKLFKVTGKVLLPTLIFDLILFATTYFLSAKILGAVERSLGDAALALLLFGPSIYSAPIAPIAAVICKHRQKKAEISKNDDTATDDT